MMDNVSKTPTTEENITTTGGNIPAPEENTPAPDAKKRRIVRGVILAVLLAILAFSTVMIIRYYRQQADAAKAQAEIEDQFISKPEEKQEVEPVTPP